MLASASWDHTVRLWPLTGGAPRVLEGNSQNVNGVAFSPDGGELVSAGYDATLRIWPLRGDGSASVHNLPTPLNTVAVAPDGEIAAAGADGKVYFLSPQGELRGEVQASPTPVIALAISRDGTLVAAAGIRGSVAIIERKTRKLEHTLVGPGLPVWSVAFFPDNRTLLTGGADRTIRRWDAISGEPIGAVVVGAPDDPLAAYAGDPGAQVFRACVACHTLSPDEGNKAGPSSGRHFRPQDRDAARLSLFRRAQAHGHRVDAGDGGENVRGRPDDLHARHQDAGAEDRLAGRAQGAGGVSGEGDEEIGLLRLRSRSDEKRRPEFPTPSARHTFARLR